MKAFTFASVATFFAGLSLAHPVDLETRNIGFGVGGGRGLSQVDINILQFALTLEHLENAFYRQALSIFTLQDFLNAGFSHDFFLNLQFIASDERTHVDVIHQTILGAGFQPVLPCIYNFPITDIASFVTLSAILESVGTSAYLGAAPFIQSKDILGVAGSILGVEAFHTSIQRVSLGAIGAPDPFTTPLGANAIFTLASQFIISCPAQNPALPFRAFPSLAVIGSQTCFRENVFAGQNIAASFGVIPTASIGLTVSTVGTEVLSFETSTTTIDTALETAAVTTDLAAATTTTTVESVVTETATDEAAESTAAASSTSSADPAIITDEAAAKRDLEVRQNSISCPAPFAGSTIQLRPDFGASRRNFRGVNQFFVTFVSGLNIISVAAQINGGNLIVVIPRGIAGQAFIFVTINNITGRQLRDQDILFGPSIFEVAPGFPTF
ncbi:hypothetical protein B0A52_01256 [Exophiala mesophila]|uniref:Uncharacterized protein n=1 Tax=Exophiala mesophila TaxID=212818 RepID=A0A438NGX2_EXOME|nr:hypothetical protein B0A52_01256 [Exophiala mesophila]